MQLILGRYVSCGPLLDSGLYCSGSKYEQKSWHIHFIFEATMPILFSTTSVQTWRINPHYGIVNMPLMFISIYLRSLVQIYSKANMMWIDRSCFAYTACYTKLIMQLLGLSTLESPTVLSLNYDDDSFYVRGWQWYQGTFFNSISVDEIFVCLLFSVITLTEFDLLVDLFIIVFSVLGTEHCHFMDYYVSLAC